MIRSALALAFAAMLVAPLSVAPVAAAPATATQLPVVGAVTGGGTFAGTLNLTRFARVNGAPNGSRGC